MKNLNGKSIRVSRDQIQIVVSYDTSIVNNNNNKVTNYEMIILNFSLIFTFFSVSVSHQDFFPRQEKRSIFKVRQLQ